MCTDVHRKEPGDKTSVLCSKERMGPHQNSKQLSEMVNHLGDGAQMTSKACCKTNVKQNYTHELKAH